MASELDALRLHVRYDEGEGPVFVLLHGINSDATDWRTVIDKIGGEYRCIALDLLGFGESPKPLDIEYTAEDHCQVLHATLAELRISDKFVLVGYSLGGDIAIRYASIYPEQLRRLFLLSTPFYLPPEALGRSRFGSTFFSEFLFRRIWRAVGAQKQKQGVVYDLASGRMEEFARGFLRTDDVPQHWDIMSKNLENTISAATFVDDLPKLSMPTVFALGVRDPIVHPDQTPALKRLKPDLEIRRIVGLTADHFMLMNLSERVAEEIMRDEVRSLHVAYRAGRGSDTPVVLLPGIDGGSDAWRPVAEAISVRGECAVLDLLGFGGSPKPLSSHYTLADHVAAVLSTLGETYGEQPVKLVGQGFGALVALACAATRPKAIGKVVAFSPLLFPPEARSGALPDDPLVAEVLAARESLIRMARDERSQALASESLELRVVPALRSLDAALGADATRLLGELDVPVRIVLPQDDAISPRSWLRSVAETNPRIQVIEPHGGRELPFQRIPETLSTIGDVDATQIYAATLASPSRKTHVNTLSSALGSANAQLIRRGSLMLLAGLPLLLLPSIPPRILPLALAIWLLVEAVQTVVGAVGLKRSGKPWLPWILIGAVSGLFAVFLTLRDQLAFIVVGVIVAAWAGTRGVADFVVASQLKDAPGRRWALVAEGILSATICILVLLVPQAGARLLRYTLGGYFIATGLTSLAFAWTVHRKTRARISAFLSEADSAESGASAESIAA